MEKQGLLQRTCFVGECHERNLEWSSLWVAFVNDDLLSNSTRIVMFTFVILNSFFSMSLKVTLIERSRTTVAPICMWSTKPCSQISWNCLLRGSSTCFFHVFIEWLDSHVKCDLCDRLTLNKIKSLSTHRIFETRPIGYLLVGLSVSLGFAWNHLFQFMKILASFEVQKRLRFKKIGT